MLTGFSRNADRAMTSHFLDELQRSFAANSNRNAIEYRGSSITYRELDERARNSAAILQAAGVRAGDRVALFTSNKLPFLVSHLGAMFAGGVPLPLNPRFTRDEMRYYLADSGARLIVVGEDERALIDALAAELPQPPIVLTDSTAIEASAAE